MYTIFLSIITIVCCSSLLGCGEKSPGLQCLESFKLNLKDPDSGQVISFNSSELIYTATNSYGARTQNHALCIENEHKWKRDYFAEEIAATNKATSLMEKSSECLKSGGSTAICANGSSALSRLEFTGKVDLDALKKEASNSLGF